MAKKHKAKVLVPVDFSSQSQIAVDQGAQFAQQLGADLVLLHVLEEMGALASCKR